MSILKAAAESRDLRWEETSLVLPIRLAQPKHTGNGVQACLSRWCSTTTPAQLPH